MLYKKEKRSLTWIVVGLIAVVAIGTTIYFTWPKVESNKEQLEVQQLQKQLSSLRSELNNLPDGTKKNQLKNKLSVLESQLKRFFDQEKQDKQTIKRLREEVEKLKKRLENDKPNKGKFSFTGDEVVSGYYAFSNLDFVSPENSRFIIVNKNHPQFKELLSKGKLKVNKQFIISYGVSSGVRNEVEYHFDKDNEKLEIKEI